MPEELKSKITGETVQTSLITGEVLPNELNINNGKDITLGTQDNISFLSKKEADSYKGSGVTLSPYSREHWEEQRAENQSVLDQAFGFANQLVIGEIVGGVTSGVGHILDIPNTYDLMRGTYNETNNFLSTVANVFKNTGEGIREWSQEATPIYQKNPDSFDFTDSGWWFQNGVSIGSTLSVFLPVAGFAKGVGMLAKYAKIAQGLEAVGMGARTMQVLSVGGGVLGKAMLSRDIENKMEASETFKKVYGSLRDSLGEEEAKREASKAASAVYKGNAALLFMDILQYGIALRGAHKAPAKVGTELATQGAKATVTDFLKNTIKGSYKSIISQGGEAFEEFYQGVVSKEAEHMAYRRNNLNISNEEDGFFSKRAKEHLSSGELWTSAFFGAFGGLVQSKVSDVIDTNPYVDNILKEYGYRSKVSKETTDAIAWAKIIRDADATGNEKLSTDVRLKHNSARTISALESDNYDSHIEMLEAYANMSKEDIANYNEENPKDAITEEDIDRAKLLLEQSKEVKATYDSLKDVYPKETLPMATHLTIAKRDYEKKIADTLSKIEEIEKENSLVSGKLSPHGTTLKALQEELAMLKDVQERTKFRLDNGMYIESPKGLAKLFKKDKGNKALLEKDIKDREAKIKEIEDKISGVTNDATYTKEAQAEDSKLLDVLKSERLSRLKGSIASYNQNIIEVIQSLNALQKPLSKEQASLNKLTEDVRQLKTLDELNNLKSEKEKEGKLTEKEEKVFQGRAEAIRLEQAKEKDTNNPTNPTVNPNKSNNIDDYWEDSNFAHVSTSQLNLNNPEHKKELEARDKRFKDTNDFGNTYKFKQLKDTVVEIAGILEGEQLDKFKTDVAMYANTPAPKSIDLSLKSNEATKIITELLRLPTTHPMLSMFKHIYPDSYATAHYAILEEIRKEHEAKIAQEAIDTATNTVNTPVTITNTAIETPTTSSSSPDAKEVQGVVPINPVKTITVTNSNQAPTEIEALEGETDYVEFTEKLLKEKWDSGLKDLLKGLLMVKNIGDKKNPKYQIRFTNKLYENPDLIANLDHLKILSLIGFLMNVVEIKKAINVGKNKEAFAKIINEKLPLSYGVFIVEKDSIAEGKDEYSLKSESKINLATQTTEEVAIEDSPVTSTVTTETSSSETTPTVTTDNNVSSTEANAGLEEQQTPTEPVQQPIETVVPQAIVVSNPVTPAPNKGILTDAQYNYVINALSGNQGTITKAYEHIAKLFKADQNILSERELEILKKYNLTQLIGTSTPNDVVSEELLVRALVNKTKVKDKEVSTIIDNIQRKILNGETLTDRENLLLTIYPELSKTFNELKDYVDNLLAKGILEGDKTALLKEMKASLDNGTITEPLLKVFATAIAQKFQDKVEGYVGGYSSIDSFVNSLSPELQKITDKDSLIKEVKNNFKETYETWETIETNKKVEEATLLGEKELPNVLEAFKNRLDSGTLDTLAFDATSNAIDRIEESLSKQPQEKVEELPVKNTSTADRSYTFVVGGVKEQKVLEYLSNNTTPDLQAYNYPDTPHFVSYIVYKFIQDVIAEARKRGINDLDIEAKLLSDVSSTFMGAGTYGYGALTAKTNYVVNAVQLSAFNGEFKAVIPFTDKLKNELAREITGKENLFKVLSKAFATENFSNGEIILKVRTGVFDGTLKGNKYKREGINLLKPFLEVFKEAILYIKTEAGMTTGATKKVQAKYEIDDRADLKTAKAYIKHAGAYLPLNVRSINTEEAESIVRLLTSLRSVVGRKMTDQIVDVEGFAGLTYADALTLLVSMNDGSSKVFKEEKGVVTYGEGLNIKEVNLKTITEKQAKDLVNFLKTKTSPVDVAKINNFAVDEATPFTFLGKSYQGAMYNDMLSEREVLTTDYHMPLAEEGNDSLLMYNVVHIANVIVNTKPVLPVNEEEVKVIVKETTVTTETPKVEVKEPKKDTKKKNVKVEIPSQLSLDFKEKTDAEDSTLDNTKERLKKAFPEMSEDSLAILEDAMKTSDEGIEALVTSLTNIRSNELAGDINNFSTLLSFFLTKEERTAVLSEIAESLEDGDRTPEKVLAKLALMYRQYTNTKTQPKGKFSQFFNKIKDMFSFFTTNTALENFFKRLDKGYFATKEVKEESVQKVLSQITEKRLKGASSVQTKEIVDACLLFAFEKTTQNLEVLPEGTSIDKSLLTPSFFKGYLLGMRDKYVKLLETTTEPTTIEAYKKFISLYENVTSDENLYFLLKKINRSLEKFSLQVEQDLKELEEQQDNEQQDSEEETRELDFRNANEINYKNKATANIKLLLHMLYKKKIVNGEVITVHSLSSGLPKISPFNSNWVRLSEALADTVEGDNTAPLLDLMLLRLKDLTSIKPEFQAIIARLEHPDTTETFKAQFVRTFSKTKLNYLTATTSMLSEDIITFSANMDDNTVRTIKNEWESLFNNLYTVEYGTDGSVIINEEGKVRLQAIKSSSETLLGTLMDRIKSTPKEPNFLTEEELKGLHSLYQKTGIEMDYDVFKSFFLNVSSNDNLEKNKELLDKLRILPTIIGTALSHAQGAYYPTSSFMKKDDYITQLASFESLYRDTYGESMVRTGSKSKYVFSLHNFLTKKMALFKNKTSRKEEIERMNKDVYSSNSFLLPYIAKAKLVLFNNLNNSQTKEAVEYKDMSAKDELILRLNSTLSYIFPMLNAADKSTWYMLDMRNMSDSAKGQIAVNYSKGNYNISETTLRIFAGYALSELNRIRQVYKEMSVLSKKDKVDFYHTRGNGLKSYLFTELSPLEMSKDGSIVPKKDEFLDSLNIFNYDGSPKELSIEELMKNKVFMGYIAESLKNAILQDVEDFVRMGVALRNSSGDIIYLPVNGMNEVKDKNNTTKDIYYRSKLAKYTLLSIMANVEGTKMFTKDPAFYKTSDDLKKRVPATIAPGEDTLDVFEDGKIVKDFNLAVLKDIEVPPSFLDDEGKETTAYEHYVKILSKGSKKSVKNIVSYLRGQLYKTFGLGNNMTDVSDTLGYKVVIGKVPENVSHIVKDASFNVVGGVVDNTIYLESDDNQVYAEVLASIIIDNNKESKLSKLVTSEVVADVLLRSGNEVLNNINIYNDWIANPLNSYKKLTSEQVSLVLISSSMTSIPINEAVEGDSNVVLPKFYKTYGREYSDFNITKGKITKEGIVGVAISNKAKFEKLAQDLTDNVISEGKQVFILDGSSQREKIEALLKENGYVMDEATKIFHKEGDTPIINKAEPISLKDVPSIEEFESLSELEEMDAIEVGRNITYGKVSYVVVGVNKQAGTFTAVKIKNNKSEADSFKDFSFADTDVIPQEVGSRTVGDNEGNTYVYINDSFYDNTGNKVTNEGRKANEKQLTEEEARNLFAPYKKYTLGDAQGYITLKRFRNIMRGLGRWGNKQQSLYEQISSGKPLDEIEGDLSIFFQPLKGMFYSDVWSETFNRYVPTYVKYSQFVLIPQMIKGSTELETLLSKMEKQNIDEAVFESGVKAGVTQANDLNNLEENLGYITLSNKYWKLQQDLPTKYAKGKDALEGSQVKKHLIGDLDQTKTYNGVLGKTIVKNATDIEEALSNIGLKKLEKDLGLKENIDGTYTSENNAIHTFLADQFEGEISQDIIEAIRNGAPLESVPHLSAKIKQKLLAKITKETVKLRMPGGAFVQVSPYGFHTQAIENNSYIMRIAEGKGLKPPRVENGVVKPGQVYVPYSLVEKIEGFSSMSPEQRRKALNDIDPRALRAVGYRIPTQKFSSIDPLEIAGVLPKFMGDTIIGYADIVAKTGSDYDIDKMYVMMYSFEEQNEYPKFNAYVDSLDLSKKGKAKLKNAYHEKENRTEEQEELVKQHEESFKEYQKANKTKKIVLAQEKKQKIEEFITKEVERKTEELGNSYTNKEASSFAKSKGGAFVDSLDSDKHFGNPFTGRDAIKQYIDWILGGEGVPNKEVREIKSNTEEIYSKLGDRTQSENVVIDKVNGRKPAIESNSVVEHEINPHNIRDFSFFASFGNPHGFKEAKIIGQGNDRFNKTTQFKNTDFYTTLEILNDGKKKLSIHFKHLEQGSNRGGGHAGLVFVFDKDKKIDNQLVENLIPKIEKFRSDNFTKEGTAYRINTNNPTDIKIVDIRENEHKPIVADTTRDNNSLEVSEKGNTVSNLSSPLDSSQNNVKTISEDYGVVQVETNPTDKKTKEFIDLIKPQIQTQLYKENKGKNANEMFHYGLMWSRTNQKAKPVKIQKFEGDSNNYYNYHELDQNGNPLPDLSVLQPIIDEIQNSLRLDMSDYDSVIGNVYLDGQYVYPHKDTTESKTARNYPVIVYTIGNDAGLGIVDNNEGKMTFANQYDKQWLPEKEKLKGYTNELQTKNGSIYTFGLDGKGRFELTHSTPMNNKKMKDFPPITLSNGKIITKYTITLTFRRAKDLEQNTPISPKKLAITQSSKPIVAYRTRGNNFLEALKKDNAIGNPWSHAGYSLYKTNTVKEAVEEFIAWMTGEKHTDKLQDYRQAIIDRIPEMKGKTILYYTELNEPSHATALDYLINKYDWNNKQNTKVTSLDTKGIDVESNKETERANWIRENISKLKGKTLYTKQKETTSTASLLDFLANHYELTDNSTSQEVYNAFLEWNKGTKTKIVKYEKGNSEASLKNAKLDNYWTVLTSMERFKSLVSPVDAGWLKDQATDVREIRQVNYDKKGLDFFRGFTQFQFKRDLNGGKTGVGLTANQQVDHVLAQITNMYVIAEKHKVDISDIVDYEGNVIVENISAYLNAFVDIAKDPYIADLNVNKHTANVLFLLLRMGVPPKVANMFIAQKSIIDEVHKMETGTSIISKDMVFLTKPEKGVVLDFFTKEGFIKKNWLEEFTNAIKNESLTTKENKDLQANIYATFYYLNRVSNDLNEQLLLTKQDTKGAEKSLAENLHTKMKLEQIEMGTNFSIKNFLQKFRVTSLRAYKKNSLDLATNLLSPHFFLASISGQRVVAEIQNALSGTMKKKHYELLEKHLFSYVVSDYVKGLMKEGMTIEKLNQKVYSDLVNIRKTEEGKGNIFIQALTFNGLRENRTVGLNNSVKKDTNFVEDLTDAWEEMLESGNEKMREFANDLIVVAIAGSAFKGTSTSFFDLVPMSWYSKGENSLRDHIERAFEGSNNFANFPEQFIRHAFRELPIHKAPNDFEGFGGLKLKKTETPTKYLKDAHNLYAYTGKNLSGEFIIASYEPVEGLGTTTTTDYSYSRATKDITRSAFQIFSNVDKETRLQDKVAVLQRAIPFAEVVYDSSMKELGKVEVKNGRTIVTLNPEKLKSDTAIHEFAHIMIESLGLHNPLIQEAYEQLKDTRMAKDIRARYAGLYTERNMRMEIVATAIGQEGAKIFDTEFHQNKFMAWLHRFYNAIKRAFGIEENVARKLSRRLLNNRLEVYENARLTTAYQLAEEVKTFTEAIKGKSYEDLNSIEKIRIRLIENFRHHMGSLKKASPALPETVRGTKGERIKEVESVLSYLDSSKEWDLPSLSEALEYILRNLAVMQSSIGTFINTESTDMLDVNFLNIQAYHTFSSSFDDLEAIENILNDMKNEILDEYGSKNREPELEMVDGVVSLVKETENDVQDLLGITLEKINYTQESLDNLYYIQKLQETASKMSSQRTASENNYKKVAKSYLTSILSPRFNALRIQFRDKAEKEWVKANPYDSSKYASKSAYNQLKKEHGVKALTDAGNLDAETEKYVSDILTTAPREISWWTANVLDPRLSPDLLVSETARLLEGAHYKSMQEFLPKAKELYALLEKAEEEMTKGGKYYTNPLAMYDLMLEKDRSSNLPNGNFIRKYHSDYYKLKRELLDVPVQKLLDGKKYTEVTPEINKQIVELTNKFHDEHSVYIGGIDMYMPKDSYKTKEYAELETKPAMLSLYNKMIEIQKEADALLPKSYKLGYKFPKAHRSTMESFGISGVKNTIYSAWESLKRQKDDEEFGGTIDPKDNAEITDEFARVYTNEYKEEAKFIPVFYRNPIPHELRSYDLVGLTMSNLFMSINHYNKSAVAPVVEGIQYFVHTRKTLDKTKEGKIKRLVNGVLNLMKDTSNVVVNFYNLVDTQLYGIMMKDAGDIAGISVAKIASALTKYTALSSLTLNIKSFISNLSNALSAMFIESGGERYISTDSLGKGVSKYVTDYGAILKDLGTQKNMEESKTNLLMHYFNPSGEFSGFVNSMLRNTKTKRLASVQSLQLNNMAEHGAKSILMYSILSTIKVKDVNGNFLTKEGTTTDIDKAMTLDEAFNIEEGKLVLDSRVDSTTHEKGKFDLERAFNISYYIQEIVANLNGNYIANNKSAFSTTVVGKMMLTLRNWITRFIMYRLQGVSTITKRYDDLELHEKHFNPGLQNFTTGTYSSLLRYLYFVQKEIRKLGVKKSKEAFKNEYEKMSPLDKENMGRLVNEAKVVISALILSLLIAMAGDEMEKKSTQRSGTFFLAYILKKMYNELSFLYNPSEIVKTLDSPSVVLKSIDKVLEVFAQLLSPMQVYSTGENAGENKLRVKFIRAVPVTSAFDNLFNSNIEKSYNFLTK